MRVAVAGATGAVGREMLRILEERNFPADEVVLLASERSAGRKIPFRDAELTVSRLTQDAFKSVDLALFSCGASRSIEFAPAAVKAGRWWWIIPAPSAWMRACPSWCRR